MVNSKGHSPGSPIATYVTIATLVIFLIMAGPCIYKKIKNFFSRTKRTTPPDSANIIHPPDNFSIPRSTPAPEADLAKEVYRSIIFSNLEKQAKLADYLERMRENREGEAQGPDSPDTEAMPGVGSRAVGDITKD